VDHAESEEIQQEHLQKRVYRWALHRRNAPTRSWSTVVIWTVVALAAISWLPLFADPSDFQVGES